MHYVSTNTWRRSISFLAVFVHTLCLLSRPMMTSAVCLSRKFQAASHPKTREESKIYFLLASAGSFSTLFLYSRHLTTRIAVCRRLTCFFVSQQIEVSSYSFPVFRRNEIYFLSLCNRSAQLAASVSLWGISAVVFVA